jgi:triacylglycerol esterase/lipase EstA (alpha/beta hydrolase family)
MMKKCSKLLALLLAVVLAASLFALPASAQSAAKPCGSTNYPVVLVHGLLGWGSYDELNNIVPVLGHVHRQHNRLSEALRL